MVLHRVMFDENATWSGKEAWMCNAVERAVSQSKIRTTRQIVYT